MAEHSSQAPYGGFADHRATYEGFVKGAIVIVLLVAFTMVALVSFRFAHFLNVFIGFAGLIVGIVAVLAEARAGSKRWLFSLAVLVIFGLITAINIS
jgi:uncharacterized metal-binding protein